MMNPPHSKCEDKARTEFFTVNHEEKKKEVSGSNIRFIVLDEVFFVE